MDSKPKWVNLLWSINLDDWTISFCRWNKNTLSSMEPPSRYSKIYSVRLHRSEGKHLPLGAWHPAPPTVSILHGQWSPTDHSDDSKNALQRASLYHYSKKSLPIKSAESMNLILKSKFQVLSVIN